LRQVIERSVSAQQTAHRATGAPFVFPARRSNQDAEPNPLNALHAKNACRRSRNKLRNMNAGETRLAVKTFTTPA
jgi:hypothetical protein